MKLDRIDCYPRAPIFFRDGTSDAGIIRANIMQSVGEYPFPPELKPKVILDIGANIGVIAVMMANLYPEAIIHCFEPEEQNLEVLRRNLERYENARIHPVALGSSNRVARLYDSDDPWNFGGYSLFLTTGNKATYREIAVRETNEYLDDRGIGPVDLIKIDAEGSEYDVLTGLRGGRLSEVGYILGELHGVRDFELLEYLSRGFDFALQKQMDNRCWHFAARRKK
jgi:FkbM family methyltransferase